MRWSSACGRATWSSPTSAAPRCSSRGCAPQRSLRPSSPAPAGAAGGAPGAAASALDAGVERLRPSDMVFVYKRRLALILPRMRPEALPPLVERVSRLVSIGAGETWVEGIHTLLFPDPDIKETQEVLDWAEDHLRE